MSNHWSPFAFANFEHDVACRPAIQVELEHLARYTADWRDVREFCLEHGITIIELAI